MGNTPTETEQLLPNRIDTQQSPTNELKFTRTLCVLLAKQETFAQLFSGDISKDGEEAKA